VKIFNFNENNENHKVYPSACGKIHGVPTVKEADTKRRRRQKPGSKVFVSLILSVVARSIFLFLYFIHLIHVMMRSL
jgi:hypothetical protein